MKGIIFTAFTEMVEEAFSFEMLENIIADANPTSGAVYTSVGTYPHEEMVDLVVALSKHSQIPIPQLLRAFGEYLFNYFSKVYPHYFSNIPDTFTFLVSVENFIHAEVLKLYPDAQLPSLQTKEHQPDRLVLVYQSSRHLEDVAEGLIAGCIAHFGEQISLQRDAESNNELVTFTLQKNEP